MNSIFNSDVKFIIYLAGLIFALFVCFITGNLPFFKQSNTKPLLCGIYGLNGIHDLFKLPISTSIASFTFCYLLYTIIINNLAVFNLPTLVLFPIYIMADSTWNIKNTCFSPLSIAAAFVIAGAFGILWAHIIETNSPGMTYYILGRNRSLWIQPSIQSYKCDVYDEKDNNKKVDDKVLSKDYQTANKNLLQLKHPIYYDFETTKS
jgi:hypothetical protein